MKHTVTVKKKTFCLSKDLFTPSESGNESEKDQGINEKHQRKFLL